MEGIQLFRDDFDSMENRNPECSELLGTFIEQNGLTSHGNAEVFINKLEPTRHYLGYDGKIYPKFRMVHIKIG